MKMYTIEGNEVELVKKLDEGYLAKLIYYGGYDEDEEVESICDQVNFYEKLYETPPIEKFAKEIVDLKKEANELSAQISALEEKKKREEYLLNKISKFPILQSLANYLTDDFLLHLDLSTYKVSDKNHVYHSGYIKAVNTTHGWSLYKLSNEGYQGSDDRPFMVFNTMDEVVEFSRKLLINRMNQFKKNIYWSSPTFKEEHEKISHTNPVKKDAEYLKVYEETLSFLIEKENQQRSEKLKKDIEELENKRKELEKLQQT